jgi:hypothetical protein
MYYASVLDKEEVDKESILLSKFSLKVYEVFLKTKFHS